MTPHCRPNPGFPPAAPAPVSGALTVLSYGIGQDSWSLLLSCALDPAFRQKYAPGTLLVLSSETGDEHPGTYEHLEYSRRFCAESGIEYHHITPEMGYHPRTWPGLRQQYRRNDTVGSKRFPKSCTDNLKLTPIYNFLDEWVGRRWNMPFGRKEALKLFAQKYGKISMLIGLAAREEKRCVKPDEIPKGWRQCAIQVLYPLIDRGMDRGACQRHAASLGQPVPPPSNCMLCPYMNEAELLWLHRFHRADFEEWVELEARKIAKNSHKGARNSGVWGDRLLPQVLEEALAKYGHWSNEQLQENKFSHGHSVASRY
ncbi:MAG: hypothetical protein WCZ10_10500 [Desulfobulbaceae bacterium]